MLFYSCREQHRANRTGLILQNISESNNQPINPDMKSVPKHIKRNYPIHQTRNKHTHTHTFTKVYIYFHTTPQ